LLGNRFVMGVACYQIKNNWKSKQPIC